jgi:hypothetical protein
LFGQDINWDTKAGVFRVQEQFVCRHVGTGAGLARWYYEHNRYADCPVKAVVDRP